MEYCWGAAAGGFGSFVSQVTNSLVNNEFDIGRMFEDLTSSQNLRGLGISMATAGLTQGLLSEIGGTLTDLGLTRQASRSVIQTSVSTGFNVVTQDLDPREALTQMLVNVAVNIGGGMAAEGIGDLRVDNHINGLTPTGAHVVLGALVGAASNLRDPLRGAAGEGIGAGIAHIIAENLPPSLSDDRRMDIAVLGGGVGAFIAGVDTNAAGVVGTNAVERNCLMHAVLETAALAGDEIIAANNALDRAGELMTTDTPSIAESQQAHLVQVDRELEELGVAFENSNLSASDRRFYSEMREELEETRNGILNVPTTPLGYAGLALTVTPWGSARRAVGEGIGVVRGIFSNSAVVQRGAQAVRGAAIFEGRAAANLNLVSSMRSAPVDAGITWGRGIQAQGMPWENFIARFLPPGSRLPRNYKTFDFYDEFSGLAISAKTLNTKTASRLGDPTKIYSSLKKNIDAAARFERHRLERVEITANMITSRELHVAIPSGTKPGQWDQIRRAIEYGQTKGVKVKITETK